jgi:hypothetical protein
MSDIIKQTPEELEDLRKFISEYKSSLGKFQGEPAYVEWYYNVSLDCGADEEITTPEDTLIYVFNLSKEECDICEVDYDYHNLVLEESDLGFVYSNLLTDQQVVELEEAMDKAIDEMGEDLE